MNVPGTGKYSCAFTITAVGSGVSIAYDSRGQNAATQFIQYDNGGTKNVNGTTTSYGASFTTGDVIAMAVDADGRKVGIGKAALGKAQNARRLRAIRRHQGFDPGQKT